TATVSSYVRSVADRRTPGVLDFLPPLADVVTRNSRGRVHHCTTEIITTPSRQACTGRLNSIGSMTMNRQCLICDSSAVLTRDAAKGLTLLVGLFNGAIKGARRHHRSEEHTSEL